MPPRVDPVVVSMMTSRGFFDEVSIIFSEGASRGGGVRRETFGMDTV